MFKKCIIRVCSTKPVNLQMLRHQYYTRKYFYRPVYLENPCYTEANLELAVDMPPISTKTVALAIIMIK